MEYKYDNHIYMIICESTKNLYKKSNSSNYIGWCRGMVSTLIEVNFSHRELKEITKVVNKLSEIFSFDIETSWCYVIDYFITEKFLIFGKVIRYSNAVDINI